MKILLVAVNARYVHTNLAVRYLRETLKEQGSTDWEVQIREFSINEQLEKIAGEIFEEKPDILGFSCYIWNITSILTLVRRLRPVMPKVCFVAGGPEVSFDPENILNLYPELDAIVTGEGETKFLDLVRKWERNALPGDVQGVIWRSVGNANKSDTQKETTPTSPCPPKKMTSEEEKETTSTSLCLPLERFEMLSLPNPYGNEEDFTGRLVYVESSRGCPYSCAFCLSSTFQGVRYMDPERLRPVLRQLIAGGASTIKFVDRTFNASKPHAFAILDIFREEAEKVQGRSVPRAHCEMAGDLLDDAWLAYLADYPAGMIQLEIGVQSTHPPALKAVKRPQRFAAWKDKVGFLQAGCGIPVHLDLIAGLPYDGWAEFCQSFNAVYAVRPNHLQLGFLKVLKGSEMRKKSEDYGLKYCPDPPYTILETPDLTHQQILDLGKFEDILEKYYNSGRFKYSLEYILYSHGFFPSPFDFYHAFAQYWDNKGWFRREWSSKALFEKLWDFIGQYPGIRQKDTDHAECSGHQEYQEYQEHQRDRSRQYFMEALRFDYYLEERPGQLPDFLLKEEAVCQKSIKVIDPGRLKEGIWNDPVWRSKIPEMEGLDKRQWARTTAAAYFFWDVPALNNAEAGSISEADGERKGESGSWYLFVYHGKQTGYYQIENPLQLSSLNHL